MENVMNVAAYISHEYQSRYGSSIDEMKLHNLMYFTQREALIQKDKPMFDATFYGRKYCPVLKEIRASWRDDTFKDIIPVPFLEDWISVFDVIFSDYAPEDSFDLSCLSRGELSWKNSRPIGIYDWEDSDNPMKLDDINHDAARIKERMGRLAEIQSSLCYNTNVLL